MNKNTPDIHKSPSKSVPLAKPIPIKQKIMIECSMDPVMMQGHPEVMPVFNFIPDWNISFGHQPMLRLNMNQNIVTHPPTPVSMTTDCSKA